MKIDFTKAFCKRDAFLQELMQGHRSFFSFGVENGRRIASTQNPCRLEERKTETNTDSFHMERLLKLSLSLFLFLILCGVVSGQELTNSSRNTDEGQERLVILDTDWMNDCDDVVALRLLAAAHREKAVKLLGISLNACMEESIRSLDAFAKYEGIQVPLALDRSGTDLGKGRYQKNLALYPGMHRNNADAEEAVAFYRRILSTTSGQIEILAIGHLTTLAKLLESSSDAFSPLSGKELVASKVSHLWCMGGHWPKGREYNFEYNIKTAKAAAKVCREWPSPITFLGLEVGVRVISGRHLKEGDLLKKVLSDHGSPNGRESYDPMLVELALSNDPDKAGYKCVYGHAAVNEDNKSNYFTRDPNGKHRFVVKRFPNNWYENYLEEKLEKALKTRYKFK